MANIAISLSNSYADLLSKVWETSIPIVDDFKSTVLYGDLLVPGTVVYYLEQQWMFSKQYGEPILNGLWVSTEGETKSAYRFLNDLIEGAWHVEIVFDPRLFIPKEV